MFKVQVQVKEFGRKVYKTFCSGDGKPYLFDTEKAAYQCAVKTYWKPTDKFHVVEA